MIQMYSRNFQLTDKNRQTSLKKLFQEKQRSSRRKYEKYAEVKKNNCYCSHHQIKNGLIFQVKTRKQHDNNNSLITAPLNYYQSQLTQWKVLYVQWKIFLIYYQDSFLLELEAIDFTVIILLKQFIVILDQCYLFY